MKQPPENHPSHRDEPPGVWLNDDGPQPAPGLGFGSREEEPSVTSDHLEAQRLLALAGFSRGIEHTS